MPTRHPAIDAMVKHWNAQPADRFRLENVSFASDPQANQLVKQDLVAFLMAAALDRGGDASQIWNIPYRLKCAWGHLDTARIREMEPEGLAADPIIQHAPSQIRRIHLARTIISVADVIETEHGGDPHRIFDGTAEEIFGKLQRVFGVGPGIARMILIQRRLFFGLIPRPGGKLLPKLDVHIQRVFTRTGLVSECTDEQVELALKECSDEEIAIIDQVAWGLGREYCTPNQPDCQQCPIRLVCLRRLR